MLLLQWYTTRNYNNRRAGERIWKRQLKLIKLRHHICLKVKEKVNGGEVYSQQQMHVGAPAWKIRINFQVGQAETKWLVRVCPWNYLPVTYSHTVDGSCLFMRSESHVPLSSRNDAKYFTADVLKVMTHFRLLGSRYNLKVFSVNEVKCEEANMADNGTQKAFALFVRRQFNSNLRQQFRDLLYWSFVCVNERPSDELQWLITSWNLPPERWVRMASLCKTVIRRPGQNGKWQNGSFPHMLNCLRTKGWNQN